MHEVAGLVLAAGSGSRMGGPKALLADASGETFVRRCAATLHEAGCSPVVVTTGAAADEVTAALAGCSVLVVPALDWEDGMGASLRAGVDALADTPAQALVVMLVDLPGVGAAVVRRVLESVREQEDVPRRWLARAVFAGRPGHPVLIGRDHWAGVLDTAAGDRGARAYLATHDHLRVECGDLGSGGDVDTPEDLDGVHRPG